MIKNFTTREKLDEVETLIRLTRGLMVPGDDHLRRRLHVLKALADDLKARLDGAPSAAAHEIERALIALDRARTPAAPYPLGPFVRLGEELIARWPVVKQSLDRFGAEVEEKVDG